MENWQVSGYTAGRALLLHSLPSHKVAFMPSISHVIIPDSGNGLLREECAMAFAALGLRVSRPAPQALLAEGSPHYLPTLLQGEPALLFSINFSGLTPMKPVLQCLAQHNSKAAVWCVDNPWNLLSGVRDPLWKTLPLFVTDPFFLPALREAGATSVAHLPLAACLELFGPHAPQRATCPAPTGLAPVLFVGRSQFPGKDDFFKGCQPPPELLSHAIAMLEHSGQEERPHLGWWQQALAPHGKGQPPYWPGKNARMPALGAEETNLAWRSSCLTAAASAFTKHNAGVAGTSTSAGLDIVGDAGWGSCLPQGARLTPPGDYYTRLPGLYATAQATLALTSLQLPHGLNQRHFDVWAAGGLMVSDATPGLELFPKELTRPVTFHTAQELPGLLRSLEAAPALRRSLTQNWGELITSQHTYHHRMQQVVTHLEL
ncbi:glycosyltransferase family protein [Desulfovibrio cuneatus]|uniref:glycosyltransferase family protein n=1 Tax=Desulfovibrio cuneatus TaxID=159728 RepID=UPI000401C6B0|nr:glycosyltransferase [Desulfovibrio cuneatus]